MAGFRFVQRLSGGAPNIRNIISHDAASHVGDLVSLSSSKIQLAATNDDVFLGVLLGPEVSTKGNGGTLTLTADTDKVRVVIDSDALYAVTDANARKFGDKLDIAGATGAMSLAASSNNDVVVMADSSASEPTIVKIIDTHHVIAAM